MIFQSTVENISKDIENKDASCLTTASLSSTKFKKLLKFPVSASTTVLDPIVRRRSSLFGHVARLPGDTPAHQTLQCHIDLSMEL